VIPQSEGGVTQLLLAWTRGDRAALNRLMPLVYEELRQLAGGYLVRERHDHTLQPTALVHEAFLRLVDHRSIQWQGRAHFLALAATLMRQLLIDHARKHRAEKRGGGGARVTLHEGDAVIEARSVELIALDEALSALAAVDPRQARVIELRFFGGLTIEEAAEVLAVSPATVKLDWSLARAWLVRELRRE
jgi:RNA polymerase sigma factor (TIGR02999 family)